MSLPPRRSYRSFFWPVVLILAGIVALLINAGLISTERLSLLEDLWPVILIVIGLELLARRSLQGSAGDVADARCGDRCGSGIEKMKRRRAGGSATPM